MFATSDNVQQLVDDFRELFPVLGISLVLLLICKVIHDRITSFDDAELIQRGNAAVGLSRGGAYAGILIAQTGTFIMNDVKSYEEQLRNHAVNGAVALVVFTAASFVIDWFVLRKANNQADLADNNVAVGLVELSSYLSLGAIMAAAFAGDDPGLSFGMGLVNAAVFSFVGLLTLMVAYTVYVGIWHLKTRVSIDDEVDNHNVAAGIDAGSMLLGVGFVLACSIVGDHVSWSDDFTTYGIAAVVTVTAIVAVRAASLLFLPKALRALGGEGSTLEHHKNVAQSVLVALVTFGFAAIIGARILT